jgi:GAF domain-containing protein
LAARLLAELTPTMTRYGAHAVLALLNARTRYRFTGVYAVDPPLLRNVDLYDRENPSLDLSGGVDSLEDTCCALVAAANAPFATRDTDADRRVQARMRRGPVVSYMGVPILGLDGRVAGTLCHYDGRPRLIPTGEAEILASIAIELGPRLLSRGSCSSSPPT